jgi:hypothetical protein
MELEFLNACSQGDLATVRTLASHVDLNYQHPINGMTGLHWAHTRNHSHIVSFLKENGAISLQDSKGRYPDECSTQLKLNYMKSVEMETLKEMQAWKSKEETRTAESIQSTVPSQPPTLPAPQTPVLVPLHSRSKRFYVFSSETIMGQIVVTNQEIAFLFDIIKRELSISVIALFNYTKIHGIIQKVPIRETQFSQRIFEHFDDCIYVECDS